MKTHQRILCSLVAIAIGAACSSSGSDERAATMLVTLRDYKTGQVLELANESHTNRVEYYSSARKNAARKVQTDEVMAAFVDQLETQGFDEHDQEGRAPSIATGDVIRWGLEIERGTGRSHWLIGTGSSPDEWKEFQDCRETFVQLYNITISFQTVQNESGGAYFGGDGTQAASGKKR